MTPPPTMKGPTCALIQLPYTLSNPHSPRKIIHPILLGKKPKLRDICGLLKGSERKSLSHVQLFAIRAKILEWVAVPFSRGSSQSGVEPRSSALQVDSLPAEPQGKPKNTGVGNLSLLQGIFPTQELNWGLLHCRRILHQLSYQGSPDVSGKLPHLLGGRYTCLLHDFGLDHMTCFGQRKWA